MGEIYRDSTNKAVTLDIAGVTVMSARFVRGDDEYVGIISGTSALVPYQITRLGGDFEVEWTYGFGGNQYERTDHHAVVTPMFNKSSLVSWDGDFAMLTEEQVFRLEKIIRSVIESITGQKFTYEHDTISFRGSGGSFVSLPKRLVQAERIGDYTGDLLNNSVLRANDGWGLKTSDAPTWVDNLASSNPIQNPWRKYGYFRDDITYTLTGFFGYTSIPEDILLAAKILAEDYGCDESLWRDRYIDNIRAADWRIEFDGKAFNGTGNVKVDRLLQKYTLNRMVVV